MSNKAFTLIEILVTAVILGLVAFMVIPNFTTAINRSYAQDAMHNLMAIYAAQQYYYQNNNSVYCTSSSSCTSGTIPNSISVINSNLNLNIASTGGTTYDCSAACSGLFCCAATNANFTMQVVLVTAINTGSVSVPQYCNGTLNPCCQGGTPGNNCP